MRRDSRYDVVFYMPAVGALVSRKDSSPAGGAETQVLLLAKALAAEGRRVAVVVEGCPPDLHEEVDRVRIIASPHHGKDLRLIGKLAQMASIWRSLWRAPSRTVVTRCAGAQVAFVAIYAKFARRRMVYASAHVADFAADQLIASRRNRLLYELGVRLTDAIVVQTEEQVPLCRTVFRRDPTLIESITQPQEAGTDDPEAFLWIGRLVRYKRPFEYIELARAVPEAQFWMIGVPVANGDNELEKAVVAASADVSNLRLLPPRPQAELGKLLARAVAVVNTADFEGMPNVLLEGWSRGIPALVLSHDPGGVIATYRLGSFAGGSSQRLVSLARDQWISRTNRQLTSGRCREYVRQHHSVETVADRWCEILWPEAPRH